MQRFAMSGLTLLIAGTVLAVVPVVSPVGAQPPPAARQGIVIEPQQGADIYTHTTATDYRVGPALVTGIGNTLTQYTCGPTSSGVNEVIRSRSSSNAGGTWTPEQIVLGPSPGGPDDARVCDPTVVKVATYYYLAYTGTSKAGTSRIYLARSTSLGGPFTKWNGTNWNGGTGAPLVSAGVEASGPSLVIKDGTVYLYYSVRVTSGSNNGTYQTRLATAALGTSTQQPTWPTRLQTQPGSAIDHPRQYTGLDCVGNHWWADTDVKYDDTTGRWLAITSDQGYPWSALQAYESTDGRTFTKAVITRGDYQRGARTPGQLADNTGHITPGNTAIAYAHSTICGQADLRVSTTTQHQVKTGGIVEPLTSAAHWTASSGTWSASATGYSVTSDASGQVAHATLDGAALSSSSTISMAVRTTNGQAGVHFAAVHPGDTVDDSGYVLWLGNTGRLCLDKVGFGQLACSPNSGGNPSLGFVNLRIVQSGGAIKAYVDGYGGQGIAVTDADHPYLGGYVSLIAQYGSAVFKDFVAGDDVPGSSTTPDWAVSDGQWAVSGNQLANAHNDGQLSLQTDLWLTTNILTQLGDGTYGATIRLSGGATPLAWGGIALADNGVSGSWASGGYLVFLRANGNLGIHKGGIGQVVADIPTGTNPRSAAVGVRVLKTGANLQVYVNNGSEPVVNWTDTNPPAWAIGSFGVANLAAPATFTDVTYHGNQAR